jgi:hypothetical protein
MSFALRVVPVGQDIWGGAHIISVVVRAAMIFGAVQPGDWAAFDEYTFYRIFAFVNAFSPVPDITVACGGGEVIALNEIQAEGGRRMPAADYLRGNPIAENARFST